MKITFLFFRKLFLLLLTGITISSVAQNDAIPFNENPKLGLAERGTVKIIVAPVFEEITLFGKNYCNVKDSTEEIIIIDSTCPMT